MARKYHPDMNSCALAPDRFQAVQAAYESLSDPLRRQDHDNVLRNMDREAKARFDADQAARQHGDQRSDRTTHEKQRDDLDRLAVLMGRRQFAEAETLARSVLGQNPRQAVAYATLGDISRFRGQLSEAAKHYSYASQFDGRNTLYQRRYEELLLAASEMAATGPKRYQSDRTSIAPVGVGAFVVVLLALYIGLSPEQPLPLPGLVSQWTLGLFVMLVMAGLTVGSALSASGEIDRYDMGRGALGSRLHPALALALMSLASFWLALLLYLGVGSSQKSFNPSLSKVIASCAVTVAVFTLAGWAHSAAFAAQIAVWSGNILYPCSLGGWLVADSLRVTRLS